MLLARAPSLASRARHRLRSVGGRSCASASRLSHIDDRGEASMVDVSSKPDTARTAVAGATVQLGASAFDALAAGQNAKGNVLALLRLAVAHVDLKEGLRWEHRNLIDRLRARRRPPPTELTKHRRRELRASVH